VVLCDTDIRSKIISDKLIEIPNKPYLDNVDLYEPSIQPGSYDVRLGTSFKRPTVSAIKAYTGFDEILEYESINAPDGIIIKPHSFLLGTTIEIINLPKDITALVEGRSSVGRRGLFIQNAGVIDAGYAGQITLELYNASDFPIQVAPGRRIGQILFFQMTRPCEKPYDGKYQGQWGATESRLHRDTN
jgi:dCTP deaminase